MSDKLIDNMVKASSPFRTPATSLDQANAYATYDLTHPNAGSSGGSSGIGLLVVIALVAPFALIALVGAAIAGVLLWAIQQLLSREKADFDSCFITAFFGMFAIGACSFGVALCLAIAGTFWPAGADLAYAVDFEITRVVSGNPLLSSVATTIFGDDIIAGLVGEAPLPPLLSLLAKAVLYTPGILIFGWLIAQRVVFSARGAWNYVVALTAAVALTLVSLPLAGWLMAQLAPHAAFPPLFDNEYAYWLLQVFWCGASIILFGALLFVATTPFTARLVGGRRLPAWNSLLGGLAGFSLYVVITLCVMVMFRHGDALVAWADGAARAQNPMAAFSSLPALSAALGGYLLVQLPGLLALGRVLGSYTHSGRGVLRYAVNCLTAQALAVVAVPLGLLAALLFLNVAP